ncbi:ATP-binding protein [Mesorhizobium sp. M1060]|uniref:sensor histidine kinase n=1 Tax=Mesorhizobium sp. M1060 TaxID=2957052 RepID=UPI0033386EE1
MPGDKRVTLKSTFRRHGIRPLTLRFESKTEEAQYQNFVLESAIFHIRYAYAFAAILTVIYVSLDPLLFVDKALLDRAIVVRFFVLLPVLLSQFALTYSKMYKSYAQLAGSIAIVTFSIGIVILAFRANEAVLIDNYSSIIMILIYAYFVVGLFFRFSGPVAAIAIFLYIASIAYSPDIDPAVASSLETSLVVIFLLMGLSAYQKELISRQLYLTETRERERLARQTQQDARHLEWLRTLARFLRHEVRQPVAQINSSLELVGLFASGDDRVQEFLSRATIGTQNVWNLIERAGRATDVEAYVRERQRVRMDLHVLLLSLVNDFRQTHSGLEFSLNCDRSIVVHDADPLLIEQAIRNLLSNAASFATEHTTVEINVEHLGAEAVISVLNQGPLAPADTDSLFGPFSSTRAAPTSEHHGLGLYLVRLVAEQHGGRAELKNLDDGTGVVASLTLPFRGA